MPCQDNGGFSWGFSNLKNAAACPWEEPASVDMFMWFPEVGGGGGRGLGDWGWGVTCGLPGNLQVSLNLIYWNFMKSFFFFKVTYPVSWHIRLKIDENEVFLFQILTVITERPYFHHSIRFMVVSDSIFCKILNSTFSALSVCWLRHCTWYIFCHPECGLSSPFQHGASGAKIGIR